MKRITTMPSHQPEGRDKRGGKGRKKEKKEKEKRAPQLKFLPMPPIKKFSEW